MGIVHHGDNGGIMEFCGENLAARASHPAEAAMELGNKVLLFPELFSFAFDPHWGNDSLCVHGPLQGKLQSWPQLSEWAPAAPVCFSVLHRDGVVTKGKQGER